MTKKVDKAIPIEDKIDLSVAEQIKLSGGATVLARRMNVPTQTVHNWGARNSVPGWRMKDFLKATTNVPR